MGCIPCGRGFHKECNKCRKNKCHGSDQQLVSSLTGVSPKTKPNTKGEWAKGQPIKDPANVKDRHSTGRKRAAQLYPIFSPDDPCEWRLKKNCGGGQKPITGCLNGKQEARHHGPVKDTLRNEPGNVHRICTLCHNRWHADNDPIYSEEENNKLPHSPQEATELEVLASDAQWKLRPFNYAGHHDS